MAKRLKTKIGDIFEIPINSNEKRYMQLIAFDLLQLNSDVVRIFEDKYLLDANPTIESILDSNILYYIHCGTDLGLKLNFWQKIGNCTDVSDLRNIIFRDTNDYGHKVGDEPIKISNNWYIWRIGDKDFTKVGKLEGENRMAYIGMVINPKGIVEIAKGNKYPPNYPDYV